MHYLCKQIGRQGCNFTGLQYHRAAHSQRRRNFAGNLIDRPIPRRNQATNANRLLKDTMLAQVLLKLKSPQNPKCLLQMSLPGIGLRSGR